MSFFPFIENKEVEEVVNDLPLCREIAWDFTNNIPLVVNGDFQIVEGNQAIKVWVNKALLVPRFQYDIYSWDYGNELMELIGKAYSKELTKSEAMRYIEEALLINSYIKSVNVNKVDFNGDKLNINVQIETVYGQTEVSL